MKYSITLLLITISYSLTAQNPGYMGKKNIVEVFGTIQNPLFSNLLDMIANRESYMKKGNKLEQKRDQIDVGYHFNISHAFSRRFGLAFEYGYDFFSISSGLIDKTYVDQFGFESSHAFYGEHENLAVKSQIMIPKIEFTSKGGLLPIGITHQLGFGFRSMSIVKKDYLYDLGNTDQGLTTEQKLEIETNLTKYSEKYKGKTLVYVLNLRSPISENILLNYGIRYTLNFMKRIENGVWDFEPVSDYYQSEYEIQNTIRSRTRGSLIFLYFGFSFAF